MSNTIDSKLKILKDTALKNIEKKFGEDSYFIGEKVIPKVPIICSTGSLSLDIALCMGGFPRGRIIEIGGQESSGKSTLTLINIAECQRNGELCAYVDVEQTFDPIYAARLGVDIEKLTVLQPDSMEETFEMLFDLLNSKVLTLIVIDSTNAMIPRKMLENDVETALMARGALLMSSQLPKVRSLCSSNNVTCIFISQIRQKIGIVYGSNEKIGIGEAMKFYASVRIKTSKAELQKDEGEEGQSSVDVVMSVIKNKVGVPFRKAQFTLLTGVDGKYGIDTQKEIIDYAVRYNIINKAGSWYSYGNDKIGQGINNVKKYFDANKDIFELIKTQVKETLEKEREKLLITTDSFNEKMSEIVEETKEPKRRKAKNNNEEVADESNASDIES